MPEARKLARSKGRQGMRAHPAVQQAPVAAPHTAGQTGALGSSAAAAPMHTATHTAWHHTPGRRRRHKLAVSRAQAYGTYFFDPVAQQWGPILSAHDAASFPVGASNLAGAQRLWNLAASNDGMPPVAKQRGSGGGGGGGGGGGNDATPEGPLPAATEEEPRRVLMLMSDTGGGHRASAQALRDTFYELYGNRFQIEIVDIWTNHTPWPINKAPRSYSFMVRHSWLWRLNYRFTQPAFIHQPIMTGVGVAASSRLSSAFKRFRPQLVVSVHPLLQHVPLKVLRTLAGRANGDGSGGPRGVARAGAEAPTAPPPFATVVTDFTTCHPTWFHRRVDRCFVATEEAFRRAKKRGLLDKQITRHGLPIRPAFSKEYPAKYEMRRQLGLDPAAPLVMLTGGGEGMGTLETTCDAVESKLKEAPHGAQIVVICGRNKALVDKLKGKPGYDVREAKPPKAGSEPLTQAPPQNSPAGCRVFVQGFVNNMADWMAASDIIVTKAGPGTIAEALCLGLPLILNGRVPCQEEGNVDYIVRNKVGYFLTQPDLIANQVWKLMSTPAGLSELKNMATRAKSFGKPEAVYQIVRDLAALSDSRVTKFNLPRSSRHAVARASNAPFAGVRYVEPQQLFA